MSLDNPELSSDRMPMDVAWKEILTKATLTAALAGAAAAFLVPSGSVSIAGMSVPQAAAIGLGAAGGSVVGDLAHKYVLPHIPQNEKYIGVESAAVSIAGSIAGAYLGMNMIGETPLITAALLGGGSYIGADFLYQHVIDMSSCGFIY